MLKVNVLVIQIQQKQQKQQSRAGRAVPTLQLQVNTDTSVNGYIVSTVTGKDRHFN